MHCFGKYPQAWTNAQTNFHGIQEMIKINGVQI